MRKSTLNKPIKPAILVIFITLGIITGVLLTGCGPRQIPTPVPTNTLTPTKEAPTATPPKVQVVDNGAPLAPHLLEYKPSNGQDLTLTGDIDLTFDQPMNAESISQAWSFKDSEGEVIPGKISWKSDNTLHFSPDQSLQAGKEYRAIISTKGQSSAGVQVADEIDLDFQTTQPLEISQVFPGDGSTGIENQAVITVIFNKPVTPLVIAEQQSELPNPITVMPEIAGKGEWINTSMFVFRPDSYLRGGTQYQVTVKSGLKDAVGETQLSADYTWNFTTAAPGIDGFWLTDNPWDVNPQDGRVNIPLQQGFAIRFRQPMDRADVEKNLGIVDLSNERVPLEYTWKTEDTLVVFTPTQRMTLGAQYFLKLDQSALALDGGHLDQGIDWRFFSVQYPKVVGTEPGNGAIQSNFDATLRINFSAPMRFATLTDKVVIDPQPSGDWRWYYEDCSPYGGNCGIYAFGLQPSTHYTVQILPGMEDLYGNKTLETKVVTFTTAAYAPNANLQIPLEGPAVYRISGVQEFFVAYQNIRQLQLRLYQLPPDRFAAMQVQNGEVSPSNYRPDPKDLVWQVDPGASGKLNERVLKSFKPEAGDGAPLEPGYYLLTLDSPQVEHPGSIFLDQRLVMVASANLTLKTTNTEALVWVTDMTSGEPLAGVQLAIYDTQWELVGRGVSDAQGIATIGNLKKGIEWFDTFFAVTDDPKAFGFAAGNWSSGISPYNFGIWQDYYSQPDQPKAYIYTDRPLYRPGQPVYFKGVVRIDDDLHYRLPNVSEVDVTIESYQEVVYEKSLSFSEFGSFAGELFLDEKAALGPYSIKARFPGSEVYIGEVTFNVAEYHKPEFLVDVTAEPANVLTGGSFTATVQADYYAGGPLVDAQATWDLRASPFSFTPPDEYSSYSFTDDERDICFYCMMGANTGETIIADGKAQLDEKGHLALRLPAELSDAKTSQQFRFEVAVTDFAGTTVAGRATLVVHQSEVYPGIRTREYVGQTGKESTFDLVALDWDGKPMANQQVNVEVVERRWYSVQKQDEQGHVTWDTTVQEIPAASFENVVLDSQGKGAISFIPDKGGVYRARIIARGSQGNPGQSSTYIWVAGDDYVPWRQSNDRSLALVTDRQKYAPGDTAEILIASPFEGEWYALVTVERGHMYSHEVLLMKTNSTLYRLPITAEMAPSVYVSVLVIKGFDLHGPPDFRMGLARLNVERSEQAMKVEVIPDQTVSSPGGKIGFTVKTSDAAGQPVQAEVSLGLSDLAALSLSEPNSQPILDYFYYERGLSVWTAVPIVYNIENFNAELAKSLSPAGEGMGSGGGKGAGEEGVIQVRGYFPDTAYWQAQVLTGSSGETHVSVVLPDNLTTWRMDARAITENTSDGIFRVGQTQVDILSTKPLLVRPQTPRFFTAGDQVTLGTAVHNNTDQDLSVKVDLEARGISVTGETQQVVDIAAHRQAYVSWQASVPLDSQRVDLVFRAEGGNYSDASLPTVGTLDNQGIPVYRYEVPETVGTSGQMLEGGTQVEAISLPPSWDVQQAKLTVEIAPSLAAGMTDSLTYLEHYPYECAEQTVSRFLPNVVSTRALKAAGLSNPELEAALEKQVSIGLQRLYNEQNPDGGWGWWGEQKSDPLTSAYVVLGLLEAKDSGYTTSQPVITQALFYLRSQVRSIGNLPEPYLANRQAFILYVLARSGSPRVSDTVQLYDVRQNLALYARAYLAQTLHMIDAADPRIQTLLSDFASGAIASAAGTHWEEGMPDHWNWNTDTRTTAIILDALSKLDEQNMLNANAVRWLMAHRTKGAWASTQETAWTLIALTDWMVASGELQANYAYAVAFNGETIGSGQADQQTLRATNRLMVDVTQMMKDKVNRLAIAREPGPGNLYYTAYLNVNLPVEQVQSLDRGIQISRSYYHLEDTSTPVTKAAQGDMLLVRLTLVVPDTLRYVVVDDPLPAGLEAVDQTLETSEQNVEPQAVKWDDIVYKGWGWWYFSHIEMRDERVVLSADVLSPGTYVYTYLARASTVGQFRVIPPTAQEFYFPDVSGRGSGSLFEVTP